MTIAAITKLFILIIVVFIICLPEFFTSYRELRVTLRCRPYDPCEDGGRRPAGGAAGACGTPLRLPDCAGGNGGADQGWFECDADADLPRLRGNASLSGVSMEVWAELPSVNITLYGRLNQSGLSPRPPRPQEEEEEGEEEEEEEEEEEARSAFYCCLPAPPVFKSPGRSACVLRLTNQTVREAQTWPRPQREGWCVFRIVWLALLCVVLLVVLSTVLGQVYRSTQCRSQEARVFPTVTVYQTGKPPTGGTEQDMRKAIPNGKLVSVYGSHCVRETALSPIHECETAEEENHQESYYDTVLDKALDQQSHDSPAGCSAHLHHRSLSPPAPPPAR